MSAASEAIARRLATRFAPELGERLPMYTERLLADDRVEEASHRAVDPNQLIQLASFVVSISSAAWGVYMGLWQKGLAKQREDALAADVEALKRETAFLKGMLVADLHEKTPRIPELGEAVRARLLDAAADGALEEATRRQQRP